MGPHLSGLHFSGFVLGRGPSPSVPGALPCLDKVGAKLSFAKVGVGHKWFGQTWWNTIVLAKVGNTPTTPPRP